MTEDKLIGTECKHARYFDVPEHDTDYIFLKLVDHYASGKRVPRCETVYNYERPFWVVKKGERNYKQKKTLIEADRCRVFKTRQRDLHRNVCKALGKQYKPNGQLRRVLDDPYIFGADILPNTFYKQRYLDQYPECSSPDRPGFWDTETCMTDPARQDELIILTYKFESVVFVGVVDSFLSKVIDPLTKIKNLVNKHLAKEIEEENVEFIYFIGKNSGEVAVEFLKLAMEQGPDWLAAWNVSFDVRVLFKALNDNGIDPTELLCHPSIPRELRTYSNDVGKTVKKFKSGTEEKSLAFNEQWHTVNSPAPFQFVCQMATYSFLRLAEGKELSYGLNYILNKKGIEGKIYMEASKFEEGSPEYHRDMQLNYPIEYIVYAIGDVFRPDELDRKIKDLRLTVTNFLKSTPLKGFESNPTKATDKKFFNRYKKGMILGCVGSSMEMKEDEWVFDKKDWIVTLPSFNIDRIGLHVLKEYPTIQSMAVLFVSDLDCISSYPRTTYAANIGQETQILELAGVKGILESTVRIAGINLTGGPINAWEIATTILDFPGPDKLLEAFNSR